MTQFYILEIQQQSEDGGYAHLVHVASDEDPRQAMLKGESVYHQVLAAAAISELACHAATMLRSDGTPVHYQCYRHGNAITNTFEEDI